MRTNQQVEVVVFKKENSRVLFLVLKRNPSKGGFWQPITGGIEEGETFDQAAIRETNEEIGVPNAKLIDIDFEFEFVDHDENHFEKCFAVEVPTITQIVISHEHTEFKWVDIETAINDYLKYPKNKEAFRKTLSVLNYGKN